MLWVKSFHIIFLVTWFAGLFYLPRLFVYHAMSDDSVSHERFVVMERKLFWGITTPGGILTLFFGLWLLQWFGAEALRAGSWLQVKLLIVVALVIYHVWCGKLVRDFRDGRNRHGHVWYRWFNEAPVLALIAIVLLAVIRPA